MEREAASFSWMPPKPPFDMTRTRSPARQVSRGGRRYPSTSGMTTRAAGRTPSAATSSGRAAPTAGSFPPRTRQARITSSASERAIKNPHWNFFLRLVFDQGLEDRHDRRPGYRPRTARIVSRTAVGWCAKSSITRTRNSPTTFLPPPDPGEPLERPGERRRGKMPGASGQSLRPPRWPRCAAPAAGSENGGRARFSRVRMRHPGLSVPAVVVGPGDPESPAG